MKCSQERLVIGHPKVARLPAQTRGKDRWRLGGPTGVWQMGMCLSAQWREKALSTWLLDFLWSPDTSELPFPFHAMIGSW